MRARSMPAISLCAVAGLVAVAVAWPAPSSTSAFSLSAASFSAGSAASAGSGVSAAVLRVGRQTLPAGDGWASAGTGTTGGSAADAAHVSVARNRAELITALGGDAATNGTNATAKIVFISGRIDMSVDADNQPLACDDYADPAYDLDDFLAAYDPAVWGRASKPTGPLEEARVRSAKRQGDQIRINVGANTTLIGINGARIDWINHNTFSDGDNHDANQPLRLGRPYQVHDGASDIIRGSDLVTVSYNNYYDHDKTMLIGSTDTPGVDVGKLRVTVHHNRFANVIQRAPRVRFGQVDIYNNAYTITGEQYQYSLGVGVKSAIYAQNNFFLRSADLPPGDIVHYWKGTRITAIGSLVKVGSRPAQPVDLVAAYNAAYDPDLIPDAGWVPTLRPRLDPTALVPLIVNATAGSRRLGF